MKTKLFGLSALALALSFAPTARAADGTVCEVAAGNPQFSTLVTAVKAAGLDETLKGEGPFTVFAPTNAAFDKLPKEKLEAVLADKELLKKILLAHVVVGKTVMAKDVVAMDGEAVNGFTIKVDGKTVMLGDAKVVKPNVKATNGVIHVIDTVLVPGN